MTMIAAWMLFAFELSALLFVAAWIAERVLRIGRFPARGVWMIAMAGANVLPLVMASVNAAGKASGRWTMGVAADSLLARLSNPLAALWIVALAVGVIVCVSAVWRMTRARRQWKNEHVDNTPVLVSHDVGPALVGVMQYSIVVPQWAYTLDQGARRLLLAHEREHARKYDPLLLAIAAGAVVVAPWNLFNWLYFRRLHLAIELDCDQRVLRKHPDAHTYGELLLDVAERVLPSVMPAAAFVEQGGSLETRINAMTGRKQSYQSLRVASGLALSLLVATAACFTPRPYAIVVVVPQAPTASAPLVLAEPAMQTQPSAVAMKGVFEAVRAMMADSVTPRHMKATSAADTFSSADSTTPRHLRAKVAADAFIPPVSPTAYVVALDAAENERMRSIVAKNAPRALATFPRSDSALVLLLNDNGVVLKQTAVSLATADQYADAMYVFSKLIPQPDINGVGSASRFLIERGAGGEPLSPPLTLITAYQTTGVPAARLLSELAPSGEELFAQVRLRHPTALTDRTASANIVMMLFDTRGNVLRSKRVAVDSSGVVPTAAESFGWRQAFGVFMDSGSIIDRGTLVQYDGNLRQQRPLVIAYGIMVRRGESAAFEKLLEGRSRNWTFGSNAIRRGSGAQVNHDVMSARLRVLVHTRMPDAYGNWSRRDSVVMFLLDANNELVGMKAGPVPDSYGIVALADYISLRLLTVPADDIVAAGWTNHVASESGRVLDHPLQVVWGRLSAEATRKRELAKLQLR